MLGKAATHIRPLLRLPSHTHAQPDLFTSNPSLLHHFQPSGVGSQLVSTAQTSAQNAGAGSAGGAGRAGYSGASSGSGYTGHARAFLSLPQGTNADANSLSSTNDDHKEAAKRQHAHLILKQRQNLARADAKHVPTRTVMMGDRLAARTGSRKVTMIELEPAAADDAALVAPKKRSSIAYPAWAALPADAAPGGALWPPGAAPQPSQLGARSFSTRREVHAPEEAVSRTPAPETQRLVQPNRVLMDLAGLDIARPGGRGQIRRNSTHSPVRPEFASDDIAAIGAAAANAAPSADLKIYSVLVGGKLGAEQAHDLVQHYRTPRSAGASAVGDESLAAAYPLPAGYSTQTYNACLQAVLAHRVRGESIAPILDMYNELLERDIVPNIRTYALVIRALCLREEDIAAASLRWGGDRQWVALKKDLGIDVHESEADSNAADAIAAYQAEDNLGSALKLYSVASTFYTFQMQRSLGILGDILHAAAIAMPHAHAPSVSSLMPVIEGALSTKVAADVYPPILDILAAGGPEYLDRVRTVYAKAQGVAAPGSADEKDIAAAAVRAFVAAGDAQAATAIVEKSLASNDSASRDVRSVRGSLVASLAKAGDIDGALKWYAVGSDLLFAQDQYVLCDGLVAAGRAVEAVPVLRTLHTRLATESPGNRIHRTRVTRVYGALLVEAARTKSSAVLDAAGEILAVPLNLDTAALRIHMNLLVEAGRYAEVSRLLHSFGARVREEADPELRSAFAAFVSSAAPINAVTEVVRGMARLGEAITIPTDAVSIPTAIVEKYVAARAGVQNIGELSLSPDAWFRLLETFVSLPQEYVGSGAADAAFETFLRDLAAFRESRTSLPSSLSAWPAVGELAEILLARFGVERATELLTVTFGDKASAFLPTPEATVSGASDSEFTLPPTPESAAAPPRALQPPSAHTLHISPELNSTIDKLTYPGNQVTPDRAYAAVRTAVANENSVPSPEALGRLIPALARAGDEPKVHELYSLAQVVLQSCVPEARAQAEGWRAVEDGMIAACCFLGHLEQAGMHRARIIEAGMAPSADAYATMIACSRDSTDDALVARELFDESQALGVVPHLYLFNTIISKLSKARKAEMVLELFAHMKASGIRPSSVTYGAVINACCRVGDAESATTLFEEMAAQPNFKPRVPPFNTMMQFHLQTRPSRERVLYYYDQMRNRNVHPSSHTYKLLLDAFGTLSPIDLTAMDRVFNDLCADRQVHVQGTHWASLITAFGIHADDVTRALTVFDSIATHPSTRKGAAPEPVVWEAILNVLGQRGTLAQLEAMRARLSASGVRPTAYVCNVLISGYSRHGEIAAARDVFESMDDSLTGVAAPNNHPALLTSSGNVKPSTTTPAPTTKVYREPSTYEAMIRAELAAGHRDAADAVLRRMEERRYPVAVWMKARAILDEVV